MTADSWLSPHKDGATIRVRVQTRSSRHGLLGLHGEGEALKWGLKSAPVDGKANEELIAEVAEACKVPKKFVTILRGETCRDKVLLIHGLTVDALLAKLTP